MSSWKNKIFDDFWKYLVGLAGGGSITGLLLDKAVQIPLWAWMTVSLLFGLCFLIMFYWYYPTIVPKFYKRRFFNYWIEIKGSIDQFHNSQNLSEQHKVSLEKKYSLLKGRLGQVLSTYHLEIQDYLNKKHKNRGTRSGDMILGNFKQCLYPSLLGIWKEKVKRRIPEELDCFDELALEITSLKI